MPQKPNKAGNMQDYVPAGNGDQSGEYTFSFSHFSKPQETQSASNIKNGVKDLKTQQKEDSVDYYVSGDGMYINNYLRQDQPLDKEEEQLVKDLDNATSYKIPDGVLYRSVDAQAIFGDIDWEDYDNLSQLLRYGESSFDKGGYSQNNLYKAKNILAKTQDKEITEKGYMSTTRDEDIALNWGGFSGSEMPITLKINTNDKAKGYDVSKFYEVEDDPQNEVLLSRNSKYKIKDIGFKDGNIYIEVDLI